jgi:hypothetical protein|eukprot:30797-Pelagococcus_subviridis.AAC.3
MLNAKPSGPHFGDAFISSMIAMPLPPTFPSFTGVPPLPPNPSGPTRGYTNKNAEMASSHSP